MRREPVPCDGSAAGCNPTLPESQSGIFQHFLFGNVCQCSYICPSADNRSALIACNWCLIFQVGDGKHIAATLLTAHYTGSFVAFARLSGKLHGNPPP